MGTKVGQLRSNHYKYRVFLNIPYLFTLLSFLWFHILIYLFGFQMFWNSDFPIDFVFNQTFSKLRNVSPCEWSHMSNKYFILCLDPVFFRKGSCMLSMPHNLWLDDIFMTSLVSFLSQISFPFRLTWFLSCGDDTRFNKVRSNSMNGYEWFHLFLGSDSKKEKE